MANIFHRYIEGLRFLGMGKYKRPLGARKYRDYNENTLEMALQRIREGMSSREAESQFNIPRRTLLNKLNQRHTGEVGRPTTLNEVEERHLADVLIVCAEFGSPMRELDLRMLVKNYLESD